MAADSSGKAEVQQTQNGVGKGFQVESMMQAKVARCSQAHDKRSL